MSNISELIALECQCRFCFETTNDEENSLITPCRCTGSQHYVHKSCLMKWQVAQLNLVVSSRRPAGQSYDEIYSKCSVCGSEFEGIPRPNPVAVFESYVGPDVVSSLSNYSLLVSTRDAPERDLPDVNNALILLLRLKRAHWIRAVYFIFSFDINDLGDGTIRALNLTRSMNGSVQSPIPDEVLFAQEHFPHFNLHHFNGGPVLWGSYRSGMCILTNDAMDAAAAFVTTDSLTVINKSEGLKLIIAKFSDLLEYLACVPRDKLACPYDVFSFSGYAQWTRLQLLGEIQRGSWKVTTKEIGVLACMQDKSLSNQLWDQFLPQAVGPIPGR
jgi:hypothetical protein